MTSAQKNTKSLFRSCCWELTGICKSVFVYVHVKIVINFPFITNSEVSSSGKSQSLLTSRILVSDQQRVHSVSVLCASINSRLYFCSSAWVQKRENERYLGPEHWVFSSVPLLYLRWAKTCRTEKQKSQRLMKSSCLM